MKRRYGAPRIRRRIQSSAASPTSPAPVHAYAESGSAGVGSRHVHEVQREIAVEDVEQQVGGLEHSEPAENVATAERRERVVPGT